MRFQSEIRTLSRGAAKWFIERWHYSGCVPSGRNDFFGFFVNRKLYAVASFGNGVNPHQELYLSRVTGYSVNRTNLVELKRLCRAEPKLNSVQLTQFIAGCCRILQKRGVSFVIAFSDPTFGHNGGIYKAANFTKLGKTKAEWHVVDSNGEPVHRRRAYRYAKRNGVSIQEAREILGLSTIKTLPKDRWFFKVPGSKEVGL